MTSPTTFLGYEDLDDHPVHVCGLNRDHAIARDCTLTRAVSATAINGDMENAHVWLEQMRQGSRNQVNLRGGWKLRLTEGRDGLMTTHKVRAHYNPTNRDSRDQAAAVAYSLAHFFGSSFWAAGQFLDPSIPNRRLTDMSQLTIDQLKSLGWMKTEPDYETFQVVIEGQVRRAEGVGLTDYDAKDYVAAALRYFAEQGSPPCGTGQLIEAGVEPIPYDELRCTSVEQVDSE